MKLEAYLHESRLSQASFAAMIGTSQRAISHYVRGARFPKPATMIKIRQATNESVGYEDFVVSGDAA